MIRQLVDAGIETNPSSNYLIGTIRKYEEHPILRFNARKLRTVEAGVSLSVSIILTIGEYLIRCWKMSML